jgi:hypothetical protein
MQRELDVLPPHEAMPVYPQLASYGIDHSEQTGLLDKKFTKFISRKERGMLLRYHKNHATVWCRPFWSYILFGHALLWYAMWMNVEVHPYDSFNINCLP